MQEKPETQRTNKIAQANKTNKDERNERNERNEGKSFMFRNLDYNLHTTWKTCASMAGQSMEEFGIEALKDYIKRALLSSKEE
jgi:predicted HicB family RNase H-like nuclease